MTGIFLLWWVPHMLVVVGGRYVFLEFFYSINAANSCGFVVGCFVVA
jgi:hypothetical protein